MYDGISGSEAAAVTTTYINEARAEGPRDWLSTAAYTTRSIINLLFLPISLLLVPIVTLIMGILVRLTFGLLLLPLSLIWMPIYGFLWGTS